eukprot:4527650-Pyramimonas_sp.AAC.1
MASRDKGLQEVSCMRSQAVGVALRWAQDEGADSTPEAAPANSELSGPPPDRLLSSVGTAVKCNPDEAKSGPAVDKLARARQRSKIDAIKADKHPKT